eukprot:jgi/Phyca11/129120/e_gw1.81.53.1
MRLRDIECLAIAVFLLFVSSSALSTRSGSPPRKLLRLGDEERAITVLDDITASFLSPITRLNLRKWYNQEKSADEVLALLKLDDGVDGLLSRRNIKGLKKYISWLNAKNPDNPVTMVETLSKQYKDDLVAKMLELGKRSKSSRNLGLKVTNTAKARYWLWRKQSVENVFHSLKLDSGLDKILDNPKLQTWATYVDLVNKRNPDSKVTMAEILIKTYGDLPVAVMLQRTRSSPKLARRLRVEQIQGWKSKGKSADEVFTLLKLDKAGSDLFVSPQLNTWYNYVNVIEKDKAKAVMASVLLAHYGEVGLSKIFREANPRVRRMRFVRLWLETAVAQNNPKRALTPEEYFRVLKLDAGIDQLLTNPNLVTWITFLGQFNAKNPGKGTTMIKIFTKVYGDEPLATMLEAAKKVPKTR